MQLIGVMVLELVQTFEFWIAIDNPYVIGDRIRGSAHLTIASGMIGNIIPCTSVQIAIARAQANIPETGLVEISYAKSELIASDHVHVIVFIDAELAIWTWYASNEIFFTCKN